MYYMNLQTSESFNNDVKIHLRILKDVPGLCSENGDYFKSRSNMHYSIINALNGGIERISRNVCLRRSV